MKTKAPDSYYYEDKENSSFTIHNTTSRINYFYQITAPFQITYEYCSGTGESDYINVITLSEDDTFLSQEPFSAHNYSFHKTPSHFHDYFEIMLVLEGTIIQKIEDKEYQYNTGSCCLINRSLCHKETFTSSAKILFIGLSTEFTEELFASHKAAFFKKEQDFTNSEIYKFIVSDLKSPGTKSYLDFVPSYQNLQNDAWIHSFSEHLILEMLYPKFGSSYQIKGMICSLLQYLSSPQNYHCTCVELHLNSDFLLFSRISHFIEENNGRISRSELESALNYSGDYLNRIVNKYAGMCLFDYSMTFCLKKAEYYLTNTTESISSIANMLHFSNRTHFYQLFKDKYGMTPKEYRQNFINNLQ